MSFLDRLGLGRPDLRAWAMYDWANSAFQTTIIAAVFPIYYQKVAAAGLPEAVAMSRFAWATTLAILIVAIVAPVLGAIADYSAIKKRLLGIFLGIGAVVIPGTRPKEYPAGTYGVPCALIIGRRTESTDRKTSLNQALRELDVAV